MSGHKLNKSNSTDFTMGELVETFEGVLKDFEVVSKSEVEDMIDSKLSKAEEGGVGSIEDMEETKAEANTYDPAQLEQVLPPEVWEVVRTYLSHNGEPSEDMDVEPESDVEKAVNSAIGGSGETLRKVRGEAGAPVSKSDTDPSYEGEDGEGSETDMVLKHVNEALEQPTDSLNKSESKSKSGNVSTSRLVLDEIDRADL
ncbi:hypothetical protein [Natrarchaeobaculum sulfurireducens]|uniref:hypothetical protein n=1 Tax=Natrarchaeobaculum sulfurireducens TaxID=2044521 RepID=UPI000E3C3F78|nr:hypothetical protein [Natrarchaeobaculum sulfurireducens]